jgi:hypothetical protein
MRPPDEQRKLVKGVPKIIDHYRYVKLKKNRKEEKSRQERSLQYLLASQTFENSTDSKECLGSS